MNGTGTGGYGGRAAVASRKCEAGQQSVGAGVRETGHLLAPFPEIRYSGTWTPAKLLHLISASAGTALTVAAGVSVLVLVLWRGRSAPSAPRRRCPAPQPRPAGRGEPVRVRPGMSPESGHGRLSNGERKD